MDILANIFSLPGFYLFLGLSSLPVSLVYYGWHTLREDRGFQLLLFSTFYISIGGFLDFWDETPFGENLRTIALGAYDFPDMILFVFYCPAVIIMGIGLAQWLPVIRQLNDEIIKKNHLERELVYKLAEIEKLAVRAEEASQAKSEFLATMSHEP